MATSASPTRRQFLMGSAALLSAWGLGRGAWAAPITLAAKIDDIPSSHALLPALRMANDSLQSLADVKDYLCTFTKHERFGRKLVETQMVLKLREEPFSVYLKFLKPSAGREVIYQAGRNNNQLQVHETGFASLVGTLSLDPKGGTAMDGNRYPVTMIGMKNMVTTVMNQWFSEINKQGAVVRTLADSRQGDSVCKGIEASYPAPQNGLKFHTTRLYVDTKTGYPIRVQQFDFPARGDREAPVSEEYLYSGLKVNQNLTDLNFNVNNPAYGF